ncbi:hypothetical protein [Streptomyces erythrochromogenes]|nr:hypothetical protein OG364_00190 [Streptomyces erythrochromogenes]WST98488.1 hypothetical protein OG364_41345 [Streptomyces erythrochromogenes]
MVLTAEASPPPAATGPPNGLSLRVGIGRLRWSARAGGGAELRRGGQAERERTCDAQTAGRADAGADRGSPALPGPAAPRAGTGYEQKLDGHRAILFTPAGPGDPVLIQTRRGALVQDRWPDLVAAAETQLPHGLVLDGELVVWDSETGRLSFEALQHRATARARGARTLAARWPAYFVAFDLLQQDGQELLARPYTDRRAQLENLFSEHALTAPWMLVPQTTDLAKARDWLEFWTDVSGVEGILVKS